MGENKDTRKIKALLRARHQYEYGEFEVAANGPKNKTGTISLDFVAIETTPSKYRVAAYEVKVSRSDFLQDKKWRTALNYCHEFSFVCPAGVVKADELPEEVGLLYVTSNWSGLLMKKKPHMRNIAIPESLFVGVLREREFWREEWDVAHLTEGGVNTHAQFGRRFGKGLWTAISQATSENLSEKNRLQGIAKHLEQREAALAKREADVAREWEIASALSSVPKLKKQLGCAYQALEEIEMAKWRNE